jgi:hypothetical protein
MVYAQSFLWIKLIDYPVQVKSKWIRSSFPTLLAIMYLWLKNTGFSFNQYTNNLLMFYVFMMFYTYGALTLKYDWYNAVCLTFLIVFINSYYWEFMLHFNSIIYYGLSFNQFIQALHLIPAFLLYRKLEITDKSMFRKMIIYGLIFSVLNLIELNILPNHIYIVNTLINLRGFVNNITRFICLNLLILTITRYTKLKKKRRV